MVRLSERELFSTGVHRPFDRVLAAAGWSLLAACALPVSHDGDRALFFADIADSTAEAAAAAAQIFLGLVWIALGRAALPQRAKAIAAFAPLILFALSLGDAPVTRAAVLPFFPTAMQAGASLFFTGVIFGAAALRTGHRAQLAAAIAAFGLLYVLPSGLSASVASDLAIVGGRVTMVSTDLENLAISSLIASSLPLLAAIYLAIRARQPRGTRDVVIFLALPVIGLLELGLRSSTEYGVDGHMGIAVRASLMLVAIALTGAFALCEPLKENLKPLAATFAGAGAVALAVHAIAVSIDRTPWDPAQPPAWAEVLYRRALPALGEALSEERPLDALEAARSTAVQGAANSPRLSAAITELAFVLARGIENNPEADKAIRRLNNVARKERLPFYADLSFDDGEVLLLTYRIEQARRLVIDGREVESLWVARHDQLPVVEQRLGWKPAHDRRALVLLDAVRVRWRDELRPALAGERHNRYSLYRERLLSELRAATGLRDPLEHEAAAMAVIAESVEAHELMHVLDEDKIVPPREVRAAHLSFKSVSLELAAASELSAYLAELARSPIPSLTLADLEMLAEMETPRPEAIAGRIVRSLVLDDGRAPEDLAGRAREAHRSLFGGWLAALESEPHS